MLQFGYGDDGDLWDVVSSQADFVYWAVGRLCTRACGVSVICMHTANFTTNQLVPRLLCSVQNSCLSQSPSSFSSTVSSDIAPNKQFFPLRLLARENAPSHKTRSRTHTHQPQRNTDLCDRHRSIGLSAADNNNKANNQTESFTFNLTHV